MKETVFTKVIMKTKAALIEEFRDTVTQDYDDFLIYDIYQQLKQIGFEGADFQYTGFWSQGDGASFTGTLVRKYGEDTWSKLEASEERVNFVKGYLESIDEYALSVAHYLNEEEGTEFSKEEPFMYAVEVTKTGHSFSFHYYHEMTVQANEVSIEGESVHAHELNDVDALLEQVTTFVRELSRAFYKQLEEEYRHAHSDENVWENIVANDYFGYELREVEGVENEA